MNPPQAPQDLRRASDEQLADRFAEISRQDTLDEAELAQVIAEMDRRESGRRPPVTAEQEQADARIDRLLSEGWEFRDAYAEVHGLSEEQLRRQEARTEVTANRRQGESLDATTRRLYSEWVHLQYLAAETATRGHLLTSAAQARGVDPVTLFSGPAANARKWASEDLKRWWADHGRLTYVEFRADMLGRPADVAKAEQIRKASNDRDFGL